LVSAEPCTQINASDPGAQAGGQLGEHLVADVVTVAVVDEPELINVNHEEREGVSKAVGPLALVTETVLECPVAGCARQRVFQSRGEVISCTGAGRLSGAQDYDTRHGGECGHQGDDLVEGGGPAGG